MRMQQLAAVRLEQRRQRRIEGDHRGDARSFDEIEAEQTTGGKDGTATEEDASIHMEIDAIDRHRPFVKGHPGDAGSPRAGQAPTRQTPRGSRNTFRTAPRRGALCT